MQALCFESGFGHFKLEIAVLEVWKQRVYLFIRYYCNQKSMHISLNII